MLHLLAIVIICLLAIVIVRAPGHLGFLNYLAPRSPLITMTRAVERSRPKPLQKIPSVIIQSNAGMLMTQRARSACLAWAFANRAYDYRYFDNHAILQEASPRAKLLLLRLKELQAPALTQADVFRMDYLCQHGGVWADCDAIPEQPLDRWISPESDCVLWIEGNGMLVHWMLATSPQHPLFIQMFAEMESQIMHLLSWPQGSYENTVFKICGPTLFDACARHVLGKASATPWQPGTHRVVGADRSITLKQAHALPGFALGCYGLGLGLVHLPAQVKYAGFNWDQRVMKQQMNNRNVDDDAAAPIHPQTTT